MTIDDSDKWSQYVHDCEDPLHYNDVLNGRTGKLVYNKQLNNVDETYIEVGVTPICPICGENHITENDQPVCDDCWNEFDF